MSNTVSLCMIVKNEISNIESLMGDVCPALEQVVVVDTGSTDGTYEKLLELKKKYSSLEIYTFEWEDHFSNARNYSFSFAKEEWVFWLDGDDRIDTIKLLQFKNNTLNNPHVDVWMLDYNYAQLPSGEPQIVLGRERFIRRSKKPTWNGAIHETINISGLKHKHHYGLEVVHNRNGKIIERGRNLRILETEYSKNPGDPRTAYYYGKELFDHVNPKGIEVLEKFLEIKFKYWDDEVNARFRLAKHYLAHGHYTQAINHAEKIYHLDNTRMRAEAYWIWGSVEQKLKNYEVAVRWFKWCLDNPPPPPRVLSKEYYTWNPRMRMVECYLAMNQSSKAIKYQEELEKLLPNHPDVVKLRKQINSHLGLKPKGSLLVAEFGGQVRSDSHLITMENQVNFDFSENFDGIVAHNEELTDSMLAKIKPGGFLWLLESCVNTPKLKGLNYLTKAKYKGQNFFLFIKEKANLPSISFGGGADDFGPYRLRITNLRYSATKNAYRVRGQNDEADVYVGPKLYGGEKANIKILDICEQIETGYSDRGIDFADAVCVCSDNLAEFIKERKMHDTVFVVEDHFEFTPEEWL